jgi:hypothetical protein
MWHFKNKIQQQAVLVLLDGPVKLICTPLKIVFKGSILVTFLSFAADS